MPFLTLHDTRWSFAEGTDIRLGTDAAWANILLPPESDAAPRHAVITRSALNRLLTLIDLAGRQTRVNQHPVVRLRVLRQGDTLQIGRSELSVWEVQIKRLKPGDAAVGQKCPVSRRMFQPGDEVIACPGCGTVHGREAWFLVEHCAQGCGYPNREVALDTLAPFVLLERDLDENSRLIEHGDQASTTCRAGKRRDQVPFQKGQNVACCPSCSTPYHLECFLTLATCPVCQHDIKALVDRVFLAETDGQP